MNPNPNNYNPNQQGYNQNPPPQSQISKVMNATITTGEYFSKKENKMKKSYLTIGKLFIYANGGMSLKLDAYPTANQTINFYDIKPKNQNQPPPQQQNYNSGGYG